MKIIKFLNKNFLPVLLLVILSLFTLDVEAGGAPGPPQAGGGPGCWPPPCVPIDGGISILLAAGLGYGGKKSFDYSKNKKG